jgi:hypothetical protein
MPRVLRAYLFALAESGRNLVRKTGARSHRPGRFTSVQDLTRKLMRYIRALSKTTPPSNGNTTMFAAEFCHANELAATGHWYSFTRPFFLVPHEANLTPLAHIRVPLLCPW